MSIICLACGNENEFRETLQGNKEMEGTQYVNGVTEETTDLNIDEEYETEWEYNEDYECVECDGNNTESGLSEGDIKQIKWEHTDKDGMWNEEVLDEAERDEELGDELIVDNV